MTTTPYPHGTATYEEAVAVARELILFGDPIEQDNEYVRGVCNLIADVFGIPGVEVGERMTQVARDIGLPHIRY